MIPDRPPAYQPAPDIAEAETIHALHLDAVDGFRSALVGAERRAGALGRALDALVDRSFASAAVQSAIADATRDPGQFGYVPLPVQSFLDHLMELDAALAADAEYAIPEKRYRPVRFLEIGAGPGRNLFLVREAGLLDWATATGFDIVEPYVAAGRVAFGLGEDLFVADAAGFDYAPYDVVFTYRPFSDDARQQAFERHLLDSMRLGAYLVAPLSDSFEDSRRLFPVGLSGAMWKKLR